MRFGLTGNMYFCIVYLLGLVIVVVFRFDSFMCYVVDLGV